MESFTGSTRPYDGDGFAGYDPRSFGSGVDSPSIFDAPSPYENGDTFFSPERNGGGFDGGFGQSNGPILPEMLPEAGSALMEWRRQNAIRLAEKEVEEKELVQQIREEAEEYKAEFYSKRKIASETHRTANREKEKMLLETREKFHAEAEKNYWKAIAELIPREVPAIEKRGKKKKPSIAVVQGPKPGKPTDLSRMRQILGKLKHNPPPHMIPKQPRPEPEKDANVGSSSKPEAMVAATPAPVAVA